MIYVHVQYTSTACNALPVMEKLLSYTLRFVACIGISNEIVDWCHTCVFRLINV